MEKGKRVLKYTLYGIPFVTVGIYYYAGKRVLRFVDVSIRERYASNENYDTCLSIKEGVVPLLEDFTSNCDRHIEQASLVGVNGILERMQSSLPEAELDFEVITGILRDYNERFKALLPNLNTALLKMKQYIERQRVYR